MKYTLSFIVCIASLAQLIAQNQEGYIIYKQEIDVHAQLPERMQQMKDRIPQFHTKENILYFDGSESLYTKVPEEKASEEVQDFSNERRKRWAKRMDRNGVSNLYVNSSTNESIEGKSLFGKDFLIKGEMEKKKWKITGEQKQVGSYLCQQAIYQDSTQSIEAWFTPMIPVSAGPENFGGLPGMILHLVVDEGKRTMTAQEIVMGVLEPGQIVAPSKGEEMTKEEFIKLRDERMEEMKKEFGRRGGMGGRSGRGGRGGRGGRRG